MSTDYTCHIGPYIQVYNPARASTIKRFACANKKCIIFGKEVSTPYCSECGEKVKTMDFPSKSRIDFEHWSEWKGEPLSEACSEYKPKEWQDYQFFISYLKGTPGIRFDSQIACMVQEIDGMSMAAQVKEFEQKFDSHIERLKEVFGKHNVVIKWGVLNWAF